MKAVILPRHKDDTVQLGRIDFRGPFELQRERYIQMDVMIAIEWIKAKS